MTRLALNRRVRQRRTLVRVIPLVLLALLRSVTLAAPVTAGLVLTDSDHPECYRVLDLLRVRGTVDIDTTQFGLSADW